MKILSGLFIAFALLVCLTVVVAPTYAANNEGRGRSDQRGLVPGGRGQGNDNGGNNGREEQPRVSQRDASNIARQMYPNGRVLSVRLEGGQWVVRMDQEGNVFNVVVDANSGQAR
jgi:uncharacterized membrane protein YkoI